MIASYSSFLILLRHAHVYVYSFPPFFFQNSVPHLALFRFLADITGIESMFTCQHECKESPSGFVDLEWAMAMKEFQRGKILMSHQRKTSIWEDEEFNSTHSRDDMMASSSDLEFISPAQRKVFYTPLMDATTFFEAMLTQQVGIAVPTKTILKYRGIEFLNALAYGGGITEDFIRENNKNHPKLLGLPFVYSKTIRVLYVKELLLAAEVPQRIVEISLNFLEELDRCRMQDATMTERDDIRQLITQLREIVWDIWAQIHVDDPYFQEDQGKLVQYILVEATFGAKSELQEFMETWRARDWKVHLERVAREAGYLSERPNA